MTKILKNQVLQEPANYARVSQRGDWRASGRPFTRNASTVILCGRDSIGQEKAAIGKAVAHFSKKFIE